MTEFINDNRDALLFMALLFSILWFIVRRKRMPQGDKVPATVYCLHCNWEGRVPRGAMRCGGCQSRNLTILAI